MSAACASVRHFTLTRWPLGLHGYKALECALKLKSTSVDRRGVIIIVGLTSLLRVAWCLLNFVLLKHGLQTLTGLIVDEHCCKISDLILEYFDGWEQ